MRLFGVHVKTCLRVYISTSMGRFYLVVSALLVWQMWPARGLWGVGASVHGAWDGVLYAAFVCMGLVLFMTAPLGIQERDGFRMSLPTLPLSNLQRLGAEAFAAWLIVVLLRGVFVGLFLWKSREVISGATYVGLSTAQALHGWWVGALLVGAVMFFWRVMLGWESTTRSKIPGSIGALSLVVLLGTVWGNGGLSSLWGLVLCCLMLVGLGIMGSCRVCLTFGRKHRKKSRRWQDATPRAKGAPMPQLPRLLLRKFAPVLWSCVGLLVLLLVLRKGPWPQISRWWAIIGSSVLALILVLFFLVLPLRQMGVIFFARQEQMSAQVSFPGACALLPISREHLLRECAKHALWIASLLWLVLAIPTLVERWRVWDSGRWATDISALLFGLPGIPLLAGILLYGLLNELRWLIVCIVLLLGGANLWMVGLDIRTQGLSLMDGSVRLLFFVGCFSTLVASWKWMRLVGWLPGKDQG